MDEFTHFTLRHLARDCQFAEWICALDELNQVLYNLIDWRTYYYDQNDIAKYQIWGVAQNYLANVAARKTNEHEERNENQKFF